MMADGSKKWTHEETILYLFRGIEQLEAQGKKLSASNINMPGRTPKACIHFWDKIRKDMAKYTTEGGFTAINATPASTPGSKRATPGSRKRGIKAAAGNLDGQDRDGDDLTPETPTVKRQRKTPVKQKAKTQVKSEDGDFEMIGKQEDDKVEDNDLKDNIEDNEDRDGEI